MSDQNNPTNPPDDDFTMLGDVPNIDTNPVAPANPEPTPEPTPTQPAEGGATPEGNPSSAAKQAPVATVDPSQLGDVVANSVVQAMQKAADLNKPQPELSQEDIDKLLCKYTVSGESVEALLNNDTPLATKVAVLQDLVNGAAQNAVARSQVLTKSMVDRFYREEFLPVRQYVSERAATKARDSFYEEYPGLEPFQDAVSLAVSGIQRTHDLSKMKTDEFKNLVVENVSSIIRKTQPNFDPKVKTASNATPQPAVNSAVPRATPSSFGSSTKINKSAGGGKASGPAGAEVFDDADFTE